MRSTRFRYGVRPDGRAIDGVELDNGRGLVARVVAQGAALVSLEAPDRSGRSSPVVLALADLAAYLAPQPFFGATVGRCANRIAHGRAPLDGRELQLPLNDGAHHLHGGPGGFARVAWELDPVSSRDRAGARLRYCSPDGEQGYPGALDVQVDYALTAHGELAIDYRARSDRRTLVNLTHHSYFNLRDGGLSEVLDHELWLDAPAYTPLDRDGIPTGELRPVDGTPLDFREPRPLRARLLELVPERGGYDHNFALSPRGAEPTLAARLRDPASGRVLEVSTTQPGLQLYTANRFDGSQRGPGGRVYRRWHGVCLETQHFPDAPNHPAFPSITLEPGAEYAQRVVYRFAPGSAG